MEIQKTKKLKQIGLYLEPELWKQVFSTIQYLQTIRGERVSLSQIIRQQLRNWLKEQVKV